MKNKTRFGSADDCHMHPPISVHATPRTQPPPK